MSGSLFKYRQFGNTGLQVSELCLGAMTFTVDGVGGWGMPAANQDETFTMLNYFAEQGGNFIDTANCYRQSEEVVGKWLSTKKRDDFIVATKVGYRFEKNVGGLNRKHMLSQVEESLKKLQTHYIDLYQAHVPDNTTSLLETLRTFDDLVRSGKVRHIGVSNYTGVGLQKLVQLSKEHGLERVVCLQPQYNLLCRSTEWDLMPICLEENIAVIPWSPLAGGWLSGKHKRDKPNEGSRVAWAESVKWKPTSFSKFNETRTWDLLELMEKIAKENGMTVAQVALRWLLQKPGVTSPIIGAKSLVQLKDNLECLKKELSAEQMKQLDDASQVDAPYPWAINI